MMTEIPDIPERVTALARQYPDEAAHMTQVARLAGEVFDALAPLHGLGADARALLRCAARLHDIGWAGGQQGHHKRSLDMILAAPLPPFTEREQVIIALVARYHRKALPAPGHRYYVDLDPADQRLVRILAACLRVADGLDRTHAGAAQGVTATVTADAITLHVRGDAVEPECTAATAKADLLAEVFDRRVEISAASTTTVLHAARGSA